MAVASFGLVAIILIAVFTGSTFRRQLSLARLKTDLVAAVSHELRTPLASMRVLVDGLLDDARFDEAKTREYLHLLATENATADAADRELPLVLPTRARTRAVRVHRSHTVHRGEQPPWLRSANVCRPTANCGSTSRPISRRSAPTKAPWWQRSSTCSTTRSNTRRTTSGSSFESPARRWRCGVSGTGQRHRHPAAGASADLQALLPRRSAAGERHHRRRPRPEHRRADRPGAWRIGPRGQRRGLGQHVHAVSAVRRRRSRTA